jgi:hypothetical protein
MVCYLQDFLLECLYYAGYILLLPLIPLLHPVISLVCHAHVVTHDREWRIALVFYCIPFSSCFILKISRGLHFRVVWYSGRGLRIISLTPFVGYTLITVVVPPAALDLRFSPPLRNRWVFCVKGKSIRPRFVRCFFLQTHLLEVVIYVCEKIGRIAARSGRTLAILRLF